MLFVPLDLQLFAHKKGGAGSSSTNRSHDSRSQRRGVKIHDGQWASAGNIIIRQLGTKFLSGSNTYFGRDYTIHTKVDGIVKYRRRKVNHHMRTLVEVIPREQTDLNLEITNQEEGNDVKSAI